jgi:hypothetical protein
LRRFDVSSHSQELGRKEVMNATNSAIQSRIEYSFYEKVIAPASQRGASFEPLINTDINGVCNEVKFVLYKSFFQSKNKNQNK